MVLMCENCERLVAGASWLVKSGGRRPAVTEQRCGSCGVRVGGVGSSFVLYGVGEADEVMVCVPCSVEIDELLGLSWPGGPLEAS